MGIEILPMEIAAYEQVIELWQDSPGVGLSSADSRVSIQQFLSRNPGLSFVALDGKRLVGTVLCGHDGRRGYIHHLAVGQSHRRQGIGRAMVKSCLAGLQYAGIDKCHIFVFKENQGAIQFWEHIEWIRRIELTVMSQYTAAD
jgi:ribosomal protein S18 acetylase RimI-like enzyme